MAGELDYKQSALWKYIEYIEENPGRTCKKLKQFYIGMIKPIVEGKNKDFYFDEKPGKKFIEFCQGKIKDKEDLDNLLKTVTGRNNYEKMQNLSKKMFCGFIRQSKDRFKDLPLVLAPYQMAFSEAKYGIKWRSTGKRRFTETFLVVARKNGKSTYDAADANFSLLITNGAEVYVAASVYSQARNVWNESLQMIYKSPALNALLSHRVNPQAEIYFKSNGTGQSNSGTYKVLSKGTNTKDGLNVSHAIIDEVHALPRDVYDILNQATSARDDPVPMIDMITTAGFIRQGLYDDEYEYSKQILDGTIQCVTVMPVIYEVDEGDDWQNDEECWYKANPTLGVIKRLDYLRNEVARSKVDLNSRNTVMTKDFNIIGVSENQWLDASQINQPDIYTENDIISKFDNTTVIGGYDLSKAGDCTCAGIMMIDPDTGVLVVKEMFWITKQFLLSPECKASRVPWDSWIERGLVKISGSSAINYHDVSQWFYDQVDKHGYYIKQIGYDRWSARYLVDELNQMGFSEKECQVPVAQGNPSLLVPIQTFWSMTKENKLNFLNNPVLKWMLSNVEMQKDRNDNPLPVHKDLKRGNKIDGFSVLLDMLYIFCNNKLQYIEEK
jgi:phage terminase large subunit-like protein